VVGDMEIALQAALGAGPGVIVIAGTGSIAYGRDAQGRTARAGGWGFAISDEGSAHWIGRAAVATLLRSADEAADERSVKPTSALFCEMKSIWKVESFEQLARTANSMPDFAALFRRLYPLPTWGMNWRDRFCGRRARNSRNSPASWCGGYLGEITPLSR